MTRPPVQAAACRCRTMIVTEPPFCRQVFDVPEPQPLEVTEHRGHRCLCAACGTVTTAVFPNGVSIHVSRQGGVVGGFGIYSQFFHKVIHRFVALDRFRAPRTRGVSSTGSID